MKTTIRYIMLFAALLATAFPQDKQDQSIVETKETRMEKVGADFLKFALAKADKYTGAVENAVASGVDTALKEAPELAKEFLAWRFYRACARFGIGAVFFSALAIAIPVLVRFGSRAGYGQQEKYFIPAFIMAFALFLGGGLWFLDSGLQNIEDAIQIKVAPRVYLIDQAIKMVK